MGRHTLCVALGVTPALKVLHILVYSLHITRFVFTACEAYAIVSISIRFRFDSRSTTSSKVIKVTVT